MKTENKFKVGDYVWFRVRQWDGEIKNHTIGRITEIEIDDAGVQWYRFEDLKKKIWAEYRTKDQFTPATDSELAWYLVTNEN